MSVCFFFLALTAQGQDVIRASGGTNLSVDAVNTGEYTTISGPSIRETSSGQLAAGSNIVLTLPSGYEWNTNSNVTITIIARGANNTDLEASVGNITDSEVIINIESKSKSNGNGKGPGRIDIEGLELRPSTATIPDAGQISNTGSTGPDLNYGGLSKVAGAPDVVQIETAPDGSGQIVQQQDLIAGVALDVYAISRDFDGNFIENVAIDNESDWSLINVTGSVQQSALTPSSNLRGATFESERTGSAQIEAATNNLNNIPSETITVVPREAEQIVITTQPSNTATAGVPFGTQPVIELRDEFGNTVSTDNSSSVTVTGNNASSSLQGTTSKQATNGIISFDDLNYQIAETISLTFEHPTFDNIISNNITVAPATASDLVYLQQPENTVPSTTITPPVELQLLDEFGNKVPASGTTINISNDEPENIFDSSTLNATTNASGIATFDNLNLATNAPLGEYQLSAEYTGITTPVLSAPFNIIDSGDLARFEITATDGNNIQDQESGVPFEVQITAIDGAGNTFTDFDQSVTISADANISSGDGQTANFTNGVLPSHSITLTSSGDTRIYAENTNVNRNGASNEFIVNPASLNITESSLSVNPNNLIADGNSTSTVTLQAKDQFGNNLTSGGETIVFVTDNGTLDSQNGTGQTVTATDTGNGTYSATLTSSTTIETATVEAFLNSQSGGKLGERTVEFTAGQLSSFTITLPQDGGSPDFQTAGVPFDITVEALDSNGNVIPNFSGDLVFSSNSTINSGETAPSSGFTNGELTHSITLTESGENITIRVEEDNIDEESGTSAPFEVVAAAPNANTSSVSANPSVVRNDGVSESNIIVVLRDQYDNRVFTQENVDVNLQQIEETAPGSNATISGVSFDQSLGQYSATVTSGDAEELVEISAGFNSTPITDVAKVDVVIPNTWQPGGGPPTTKSDWTNGDNWSQNEQPGPGDFVIIPDTDPLPDLDLNINVGSFKVENFTGNELVLFGGNAITMDGNLTLNGSLNIEDNTDITVGGNFEGNGSFIAGASTTIEVNGNLSISNYNGGNDESVTRLNGENQQIIGSQNFLAYDLEIRNDVLAQSGTDLIDIFRLDISYNNTFELAQDAGITLDLNENITGDGTFILNNNTFVLRGNSELSNIDASEGTVIFGIRLDEDFSNFPDLEQQQVSNLSQMQNAIINNTEGVRTTDDIIVDGNLTFENGKLIISSGTNLIASNQTYNNGSLQIRRSIRNKGWVMLGSPINSTFADLFDGLTTQGMANSDYPSKQPNLLYYYESAQCTDSQGDSTPCTDNQRWRTPDDINNNIQSTNTDSLGRGYYFYVFGDVSSDSDYNNQIPVTLNVTGQEYEYQSNTFNFSSVTYSASADTIDSMIGWNLLSNPWAASIDWDDDNWTKTNIDNVVYVWDPSTNSYQTWNGIDGSLENGLIAPFQAFWVKANDTSPELTANKSAKTISGQFYGKSKKKPASIGFKLQADTLETETHITLTPDGSNAKDRRDGYRLLPFETNTYLELYTTFDDGTELAINNLARSFGKEISIPLHVGGFKSNAPLNGEYTLSWPSFGDIPDEWTITLEDMKTGEEIDLRKNTFYSFNLSQSKNKTALKNSIENFQLTRNLAAQNKAKTGSSAGNSRFVIHIAPGADGADVPDKYSLGINYPNPFSDQTTIKYNTPVESNVQILIYDILGRKVKTILDERRPADFHEVDWNPTNLASGVYICVMRADGKQFSKKLTYIK